MSALTYAQLADGHLMDLPRISFMYSKMHGIKIDKYYWSPLKTNIGLSRYRAQVNVYAVWQFLAVIRHLLIFPIYYLQHVKNINNEALLSTSLSNMGKLLKISLKQPWNEQNWALMVQCLYSLFPSFARMCITRGVQWWIFSALNDSHLDK